MSKLAFTDEDREEIKQKILKRKAPSGPVVVNKNNNEDGLLKKMLTGVVVVMTIVIIGLMLLKMDGRIAIANSPSMNQFPSEPQSKNDPTESSLDLLKKEVYDLSSRMWLLGIQANQNAALNKEQDRKYFGGERADRFIYIDENWKLDQMPSNIKFSDESLERLRSHVR